MDVRIKMKLKVKELMQMYNRGKGTIHTDHSTQRSFIYNDQTVTNKEGQNITRAGDVIKSILERDIQLPALYFWQVEDPENGIVYKENEFNVHDGKQRFLSIYYFIQNEVNTNIRGKQYKCSELPDELQEKLMNYELDIVVRRGTLKEEEQSFLILNSTTVPLTDYETIRGAYYGKYIQEFENYINNSKLDNINEIGRGGQAIWLLYLALGCYAKGNESSLQQSKMMVLAIPQLEIVRNYSFDASVNYFDEKLKILNDVLKVLYKTNSERKIFVACQITEYVVYKKYSWPTIFAYYLVGVNNGNDITSWSFDTHKTAINNLFATPKIECDYNRNFDKSYKNILFSKSQRCGACNMVFNFEELTVDHIKPWSKGGRTDMENAQLLCKSCNSSKGAR